MALAEFDTDFDGGIVGIASLAGVDATLSAVSCVEEPDKIGFPLPSVITDPLPDVTYVFILL